MMLPAVLLSVIPFESLPDEHVLTAESCIEAQQEEDEDEGSIHRCLVSKDDAQHTEGVFDAHAAVCDPPRFA